MKVILLTELRGKGGEGDIVDVAQGYADNYLFPNRMALEATPGNIKQLEERRHNIEKREEKRIADAQAARETLEGKTIKVDARVGEEGQLFGSVTTQMIADALAEQLEITVDRRRVERSANIKTAGIHEVTINLYREISANIFVQVGDDEVIDALAEANAVAAPAAAAAAEEAVDGEAVEGAEEAAEATEEAAEAAEEVVEEAEAEVEAEEATEEAAEATEE